MVKKLDHIGIAVGSLADALPRYQHGLGLHLERVEEVPTEQVRVAFFAAGETHLELLESTTPDGPIARAIARRGEGIHHIALAVADIQAALDQARAAGLEALSAGPTPGAGGSQVAFLHPRSTGGVLIEFVQKPAAGK